MSRYGSPYYYGDCWVNAAPAEPPTFTFPASPTSMINAAPPSYPFSWLTEPIGAYEVVIFGINYLDIGGGLIPEYVPGSGNQPYVPPGAGIFTLDQSLLDGPAVLA